MMDGDLENQADAPRSSTATGREENGKLINNTSACHDDHAHTKISFFQIGYPTLSKDIVTARSANQKIFLQKTQPASSINQCNAS